LLELCNPEPGHYHSPIPDPKDIEKRSDRIFVTPDKIEGINLNEKEQLNLLDEFVKYYNEMPFNFSGPKRADLRYSSEGAWYRYSDAIFLYCMMRHAKPKKIVEIGSGYSSAIMLDVNDQFFSSKIRLSFIEPFPGRLIRMLKENDKKNSEILEKIVQDVNLSTFDELEENDILFIDSSHVSKTGSDVNFILFEILPRLKKGVFIHFHDIFYPFEMPRKWVLDIKWAWNENYILRAFLTNNKEYEIVAFNTYLQKFHGDWFKTNMPICLTDQENTGSIWIQKV
jgi:predicted O-methyltransferase YrrM